MTTFEPRELNVEGTTASHRIYRPDGPPPAAGWPVILFLHGAGESGSDGVAPTRVGLGPAVQRNPERVPAIVVFPQASRGYGWRGFNARTAMAALDDVERSEPVDRDRVYVTGISMGGYGTMLLGLLEPRRFAALVPVCGGLDVHPAVEAGALRPGNPAQVTAEAAVRLRSVPLRVFHGAADDTIPVDQSREMVRALRAAGANLRYTEYPGVRHNSWDRAYAEPDLFPWLFAQRRREAAR